MTPRLVEVVRLIESILSDPASRAELRELASQLSAGATSALARFMEMSSPTVSPRNLLPAEAAKILGTSVRWLYDHAHELECTRRPSPGKLRFDSEGIQRLRDSRR